MFVQMFITAVCVVFLLIINIFSDICLISDPVQALKIYNFHMGCDNYKTKVKEMQG